jgi:chromosome segregation ATPase
MSDELIRQLTEQRRSFQGQLADLQRQLTEANATLDAVKCELQADANFGVLVKQLFGDPLQAAEDEIDSLSARLTAVMEAGEQLESALHGRTHPTRALAAWSAAKQ